MNPYKKGQYRKVLSFCFLKKDFLYKKFFLFLLFLYFLFVVTDRLMKGC